LVLKRKALSGTNTVLCFFIILKRRVQHVPSTSQARHSLQAAQRIYDCLVLAGHGDDIEEPLFRPVGDNRKGLAARRPLYPDVIDRTLRKYARSIDLDRGYSAHSMRATFITTALDNGASLEDVQSAAGHADPSTTKLYDRRGYNPEKSASFFANY
jgi:integrase